MLTALLPILAVASADTQLAEADHAIRAGRLEQARTMIGRAIVRGSSGPKVDRLLADLASADGRDEEALARYTMLLGRHPLVAKFHERAAISALRLGKYREGRRHAAHAVALKGASWRAWNALGVAADGRSDWFAADAAYRRALELEPGAAEPLNNWGWSRLLRGDWSGALELLEKAMAVDSASTRITANVELARQAVANELPQRRRGESDTSFAARLNDAGLVARARGDNPRAVAAFARAIEARTIWYERAWNNLQMTLAAK